MNKDKRTKVIFLFSGCFMLLVFRYFEIVEGEDWAVFMLAGLFFLGGLKPIYESIRQKREQRETDGIICDQCGYKIKPKDTVLFFNHKFFHPGCIRELALSIKDGEYKIVNFKKAKKIKNGYKKK